MTKQLSPRDPTSNLRHITSTVLNRFTSKFQHNPPRDPFKTSHLKGEGVFGSIDKASCTAIAPTAPLLLTLFSPTKSSPELHPTYSFPTEAPTPTTSHSKKSISIINIPTKFPTLSPSLYPPPPPAPSLTCTPSIKPSLQLSSSPPPHPPNYPLIYPSI